MQRIDAILVAWLVVAGLGVGGIAYALRPATSDVHEADLLTFAQAAQDDELAVQDADGDGLPDILENRLSSTNLQAKDSDGDLLPDAWEFGVRLDANDAGDAMADQDLDGLPNLEEFVESVERVGLLEGVEGVLADGLDPMDPDTDADGLPDGFEVHNALDPLDDADAARDADGDGLTNLQELAAGSDPRRVDSDDDGLPDDREILVYKTSPVRSDTDGDRLPDAWELAHHLDPTNAGDRFQDPDGDGLDNSEEYLARTDPRLADTDVDGMPDAWEFLYGLDPLNGDDGGQDPDHDGLSNLREFQGRTGLYARSTEPLLLDTDGDGLDDGAEAFAGSNPFQKDTDGEGLSDFEEVKLYRTDPLKADTDGDKLDDAKEVRTWGTDPNRFDTDGDGLDDGTEVGFWASRQVQAQVRLDAGQPSPAWLRALHPGLTPAALVLLHGALGDLDGDGHPNLIDSDSDGDSLFDGLEVQTLHRSDRNDPTSPRRGTDPADPDSDQDQMPDGWEVRYRLDPIDAGDALEDPDHDGVRILGSSTTAGSLVVTPRTLDINAPDAKWDLTLQDLNLSNLQEYKEGTNPTNHDTDCDGVPDGWELHFSARDPETGLNVPDAAVPDSHLDPDRDGERNGPNRAADGDFTTFEEWWFFTNPFEDDTDGDRLPDGYEVYLATGDPNQDQDGRYGLADNGLSTVAMLTVGCEAGL